MEAVQVRRWEDQFEQTMERVGGCFPRRDLRRQAEGYVRGLLGPVERKNGWQLAEHLGREKPYGIQRLLGRASWDADALRDELTRYAVDPLVTDGDPGVLIVDETGFLKKGNKSVGVHRQYSGTAGRIENSQVGVFLALSTSRGRALIDRALYLPAAWCEDRARCDEAGVPDDVAFATKPQLAVKRLGRAFEAGLRPSFVLADSVYGSDSKFRRFLETRHQAFVVAVTSQQRFWIGFEQRRVDAIAADLPDKSWFRMSVAEGTRGPRTYDWASVRFGFPTDSGMDRHLLVRRHTDTGELAYFLCAAPSGTSARDLAVAAGQRWAIECCFESTKQETGLDEYEVRSWNGWHRHVTLSLLAMMFLTAVRLTVTEPKRRRSKSRRP
ncbi:MAG: hypothetical protein JWM57_563 [Phycisphaerales bacterium]|nr:hypothetical protein [Phycisphaerales bacterium]